MRSIYDYKAFRCELTMIPTTPHWVVMIVENRTYSEPGYDRDDCPTTKSYQDVSYYAFSDEAEWKKMINDLYATQMSPTYSYREKPTLVFFKSSGRATATVDVKVSLG